MNEIKKNEVKDGSETIRPENAEDFQGIERAQNSETVAPTEETNEWEAREDENE